MYHCKLISKDEDFFLLKEKWNLLLASSPTNNFFLCWQWLWEWWQVFKTSAMELYILLIENEKGEVVGISPFYLFKGSLGKIYPIKRLMFLGTQTEGQGSVGSEYMDIIYKDEEKGGLFQYLFDHIVTHNICDEIYLSKMDTSSITFNMFKKLSDRERLFSVVMNESKSPYISLPHTWEEYLNLVSSSMRYKIRKERRKLKASTCEVALRKTSDESKLSSDFQEFIRLHQTRWLSRGMEGAFSSAKFILFHKKIISFLLEKGYLDLIFLSINGKDKAALYNIVYNNKVYFYLSGLDLNDTKGAMGVVLHSYCIEEAICKGLKEYDFMQKGKFDNYKNHWTKDYRTLADLYIACSSIAKYYMRSMEFIRANYHRIKFLCQ